MFGGDNSGIWLDVGSFHSGSLNNVVRPRLSTGTRRVLGQTRPVRAMQWGNWTQGEVMAAPEIDLNADIGESFGSWTLGDDAAMLDVVTSANVACGFHAGDPAGLLRTCELAAERGVVIGAHVGYPDLVGFGRRFMDVAPEDLAADVIYQIGALAALARAAGSAIGYVKPHGALYNTIVRHRDQASAVVSAVARYDPQLPLMGIAGSVVLELAETAGLRTIGEAFADRAYTPQGTLVPRTEPGALLRDPQQVAARMVSVATTGRLTAIDGTQIEVRADSLCTHGDSPGAVAMAAAVRQALSAAGVHIRSFVAR